MYKLKKNSIKVDDIAIYLNSNSLLNKEYEILKPSSAETITNNSLVFLNNTTKDFIFNIDKECLVLMPQMNFIDEELESIKPDIIFTNAPEKDFYLIVKEFFVEEKIFSIDSSVYINSNVKVGVNVNISEGTKIGENVEIGNNTYIGKNVIINDNVVIGSNCYLKDNTIISSESFDFINDNGKHLYVPFLGKLIIEDNVWIGSNVVLEKPSLSTKYIRNGVKIDDLVQIGSDVNIQNNTQIAAGSIIGRKVDIGANCLFGINSVIKPEVKISNNVILGIGTVVVKDLSSDTTYIGNPAKRLR